MKQMQSYRIDTDTIKKIDELSKMDQRSKSNVIEKAVTEYYKKLGEFTMKYTLQQAMELTGAESEEQFAEAFANKSVNEINDILVQMFGSDGNDVEFAEEIKILVKEIR